MYICDYFLTHAAGMLGFLKLFPCVHLYVFVCVFVCVSAPETFNN